MHKDERDLLDVLKFELEFVEKGGYGRSPREPWRPQFIFEDSPTCMNYDCKDGPGPCNDCVLMHWIPDERREEKAACRHIPLGPSDETLDALYRYGDQQEIEGAVATWLRATISQLESQRKSGRPNASEHSLSSGTPLKGTPLYQQLHPKCANPGCSASARGSRVAGVRDGNPNNLHVDPGAGRDLISNSQGGARIAAQIQSWLEPTAWATVAFCHHCQDDFRSRLAALVRGPPGTSIPYIFRTMRMSKGRVPGSY